MKKSDTFKKHQNKSKGFTVMPNSISYDPRLSIKGFGMLCKLLMLPEDWDFTISGLATQFKDSKDSVSSALKELEGLGYLVREQIRAERGKFGKTCYHVFEEPIDTSKSVDEILSEEDEEGDSTPQKCPKKDTKKAPKKGKKSNKPQEGLEVSPITDFPVTVNPMTGNPPQYNNYSIKELNNKIINNISPSFENEEKPRPTVEEISRDELALLLNDTCGVEGAKRVITALSKSYGDMSLSLLKKAIELSLTKEFKTIKARKGYIFTVLSDWKSAGFETIEDVEAYFERLKAIKKNSSYVRRQEIKPDWLNKPQQSYDKDREYTAEELEIMERMKEMQKSLMPSQTCATDDLPF